MNNRILIAEDEPNLRRLVAGYLVKEGFVAAQASDGQQALEMLEALDDIVLVILDVMMPRLDGYAVCRRIREQSASPVFSALPVLMLTARDTEADEMAAFEAGADDYISKPFSPAILMLRVKNVLRRAERGSMEDIVLDSLHLYYSRRQVTVDGQRVLLTPREFDLLYYLLKNRELVLTREMILNQVWGSDYSGDDRTVDTHIKCLRAKLGTSAPRITTLRKVGYKLEANEKSLH